MSQCHPQSYPWIADGVTRCSICGAVQPGADGTEVRSLDHYQALAARTSRKGPDPRFDLAVSALGLAGETGETVDYLKKVIGHGHPFDRNRLVKELGDCLWYLADLARRVDAPLSEVAIVNISKLRERYPDGFSAERSQNRSAGDDSR